MKSCWRLKADTSNSTTSSTNSSATSSSIPVKILRRPCHNPWRIAGRRVFRIYSQSLRSARGHLAMSQVTERHEDGAGGSGEVPDATDLKFVPRKRVRVRLPPSAPIISITYKQL